MSDSTRSRCKYPLSTRGSFDKIMDHQISKALFVNEGTFVFLRGVFVLLSLDGEVLVG